MSDSHPFRIAAESKDIEATSDVLTEDVVLHSPVSFKPFEGRETAVQVLGLVASVFEDFKYVHEARTGSTVLLQFRARVGDRELDGIDVLELDEKDRVRELRVFVRPLSSVEALRDEMGRRLGRV